MFDWQTMKQKRTKPTNLTNQPCSETNQLVQLNQVVKLTNQQI